MLISQYRWNQGSAIAQVDVRKFESGMLEAYVHAPKGAEAGALAKLPEHLRSAGLHAVSDEMDGEAVLRVTGFKNEGELFKQLEGGKFVAGIPSRNDVGENEKVSLADKLRRRTVNLSGMAGLVGHAALVVAGILEKDSKRIVTGSLFATSTSVYAFAKGSDADKQFGKMVDDMKAYLDKSGVELPEGGKLTGEELAKKGGVVSKLGDFINEHPMQVGNVIGTVGNLFLMASGRGEKNNDAEPEKKGVGRQLSGLASMTAALAIILIPEKQKQKVVNADGTISEVKDPERKGITALPLKAMDWVREKPLRFAGLMFIGSNVALAMDAREMQKGYQGKFAKLDERGEALEARIAAEGHTPDLYTEESKLAQDRAETQRGSKAVLCAYTTTAAYFLASTLTAISSKGSVGGDFTDQEMLSKLCAYSANVIASAPEDVRESAVNGMAEYLALQPNINETKEQIAATINEKADRLANSPWAAKVETQQALAARAAAQGSHASL